ncbi:MAG: hypothetical protein F6K26_50315, partial [Moorea sp. SIO2I5]|nr:hypothetical protein [Moorena sp. SIO2I5]
CFFYQYFIDLFFYRQKVIKAYQLSREVYSNVKQQYQDIKKIINETAQIKDNQSLLSDDDLLEFKHKLRILPKLDLNYSDLLGQLERYSLTIKTNGHNYSEKLQQIKAKLPNDEDLSFFSVFEHKISPIYKNQIQRDFSYFRHSSALLDKAISSIRGIVEIEQAERDRAKEEANRARDKEAEKQEKRLQLWITFVGTGLAVSGISSQSDAKQPLEVILTKLDRNGSLDCPKPEAGLYPCLSYSVVFVLFHILIGVGVGAFAAFIVDRMIHRGSK